MIQKLRNEKHSYQKIGKMFGISRQRVHQILTGYRTKYKSKNILEFPVIKTQKFLLERAIENQLENPVGKYLKNIIKYTKMSSNSRERMREIVRLRDKHICQWCNKKWINGERRFDIHHIVGNSNDSKKVDRNFNLQITLCHKCHLRIDSWKMTKSLSTVNA